MLLEETPHLVLEGMLIGAYGIDSHHAFIYIRGEFGIRLEDDMHIT